MKRTEEIIKDHKFITALYTELPEDVVVVVNHKVLEVMRQTAVEFVKSYLNRHIQPSSQRYGMTSDQMSIIVTETIDQLFDIWDNQKEETK